MGEVEVSDSWNNRLKTLAEGLASMIPTVGKVVKVAIQLFWPDDTEDIWSLIKSQVEHLIEVKILEHELDEREAQLNGLKQSLSMYSDATNKERASLLSAIIVQCNELYSELTESDNTIHLIPLTVAHAYLHLTVLRERYEHGLKLYSDATDQDQWEKDLTTKVSDYHSHFLSVYSQWQEWREDEISVSVKTKKKPMGIPPFFYWTAYGKTKDSFDGESVKYSESWNKNKKTFKDVQKRAKLRMYNEANASMMMDAFIRTFSLGNFLPGHENDAAKADTTVSEVSYGPYSVALTKGDHEKKNMATIIGQELKDNNGVITEIHIWAGNFVERIQFHYEGKGAGHAFGAPKVSSKSEHVITLSDTHVTGMKMGFSNGVMARVQFKFSDGSSSDAYGNRGWRMKYKQEVDVDSDFRLVGATGRKGNGPGAVGLAEMMFNFQHISVDPSS
ncbi:uncharacterized protein LOC116299775 [Actinia tenebrosa]|uniref:Uncharacterized protein LOC116299775 n=1 Tax=Actinia tenebrosa TaxID=6105 RepID=A0A6P8IDK5_ACTTE|nr:uncharacterized protein LOC116299775 [Actinia tenebrosa]